MSAIITFRAISEVQGGDNQLPHLLARLQLKLQQLDFDGHSAYCVEFNGALKPYQLIPIRRQIIDIVH